MGEINSGAQHLAKLLGVSPQYLINLEEEHRRRGVFDFVSHEIRNRVEQTLILLNASFDKGEVTGALRHAVEKQEERLLKIVEAQDGSNQFEKASHLARRIARTKRGLFLKLECGREILRKRPPVHVMEFLKSETVEEMLVKHDVTEIFSALRFMETEEWMHETFATAYSGFSRRDFEERDIELKVLGEIWRETAEKFVAKKHHNVSHLKEFGVIFLNPVREAGKGKFLRDFALLFHYFHEIEFYSRLFARHLDSPEFPKIFASLLRGDVAPEVAAKSQQPRAWLIIQRYLWKTDPSDPRLFTAHINPESVHWYRAERDLADFALDTPTLEFNLWRGLDFVGHIFGDQPVSFDLEDNAMTAAAFFEGRDEPLNYHQREALWTRLFIEFASDSIMKTNGEKKEAAEGLLMKSFLKESIAL